MRKVPTVTIYFEVGIEGLDDESVREKVKYQFDPTLTDEQNQEINNMRMQNTQMKLQLSLLGLMAQIPALIGAQIEDEDPSYRTED